MLSASVSLIHFYAFDKEGFFSCFVQANTGQGGWWNGKKKKNLLSRALFCCVTNPVADAWQMCPQITETCTLPGDQNTWDNNTNTSYSIMCAVDRFFFSFVVAAIQQYVRTYVPGRDVIGWLVG